MRIVVWARERAHELTFERVEAQLTETVSPHPGRPADRRPWPVAARVASITTDEVSAAAMRRELDKRALLIEQVGAARFDLSGLPPNRRAWLPQTGRQPTNQALARLASERRYPVLMCFCVETLERVTDDALDLGTMRELIDDGVDGILFPPGDGRALAAAIVELAEDRALAAELGGAAWGRVRERHAPDAYRDAIVGCYERARSRSGGADGRASSRSASASTAPAGSRAAQR